MTVTDRIETPVTAALIVAGGSGARFGGDVPKQYRILDGIPVLCHSLRVFLEHEAVDHILVVHGAGHEHFYAAAASVFSEHPRKGKIIPAIRGGDTRQSSVRKGLEVLAAHETARVLIHDAARPLLAAATIDAVCAALDGYDAVLPATSVADTIKRVCPVTDTVLDTIDRSALWQAQTPQGFAFETIYAAHRAVQEQEATDDIALVEKNGLRAKTVQGHPHNFKLTVQDDFLLAEALLQQRRAGNTETHAEKRYG